MDDFDFIGQDDHPAIVAVSNVDVLTMAKADLTEMGYKIHAVHTHEQFESRFYMVNYQVVLLEETFAGSSTFDNPSLRLLQNMSMQFRRHAMICLIGENYETLNSLQAYAQSVHSVINYADLTMLSQVIQKTKAENDLFLSAYRDAQVRVLHKR
ncbi:MAG TPA: hypothetical protein VHB20_05565 [Verrucomicrobiae bacterium]|jgi:hypothetical protein|nr:hypothetical protein [Verrucomicrobiae bacterium]